MNTFERLFEVNTNDKTKKKGELTYLSWAYAWAELKKVDPLAFATVYENDRGWNYHTDNSTCWVKVGVTVHYTDDNDPDRVDAVEHIEYLPVMNYNNKAIAFESVTSVDVNKAIQRALTKAIARHGLGIYIYAGEDLPEVEKENAKALADAKQALTDYCYQFDQSGKTAAKVWKKYDIESMTDPADVTAILDKYKEAEAKKAEQMPTEVKE